MSDRWIRPALSELVGVFGVVLISAGVVCVNQLTAGSPQAAGTAALTLHQPGLTGVALAQGLILAAMLVVTVPISGGYLNPAVTLTLWAFGRLDSGHAGILLVAQMLGSALAAGCLRLIFSPDIVQTAQYGAPHLNPLAYPYLTRYTTMSGAGIELILTFFLAFAIFASIGTAPDAWRVGGAAGMVQAAAGLFAYPLTGAALNPARWFGPVLWDSLSGTTANPWADFLVYLAGPPLGALLAGLLGACVFPAGPRPIAAAGKR